ncbi:MAG: glycine cleavage system protein GcvH [Thermodesulfobacteriota bacterium]
MKDITELRFPENLRYASDHEWARREAEEAVIGISDYAQDQLGDVVYVELPKVGARFAKGDVFGTVESVKAVSELIAPLAGEVVAVNSALENTPDLVNSDPYGEGWMMRLRCTQPEQYDELMTSGAYVAMLKG